MKKSLNYLFIFVLFIAAPLYATQIDPLLWEQMTVSCDFAGVVECTTAGGIVAEYKVIEAWKGAKHTDSIRIQVAVNYWEPQFPTTLIGERYLIFAFQNNAPSRLVSTTLGGPVPLWWRNIEYDFTLPLFQGRYLIDKNQKILSYDFGYRSEHQKGKLVSEIKKGVQELAKKSKQQQELILLKVLFKKYFLAGYKEKHKSTLYHLSGYEDATDAADHKEYIQEMKEKVEKYEKLLSQIEPLNQDIQTCTDPIQLIDKIYDFSISHYKEYRHSFQAILEQGIQIPNSLEHLKKRIAETADSVIDDYVRRYLPERIQTRIGVSTVGIHQSAPNVKTYTSKELKEHQSILKDYKRQKKHKWSKSFYVLAEQQPVFTAKWLAKWKNTHKKWHDENMGYELGSWMAYRCEKDKLKCLEILLDAKEHYVRVAGAVYLCFEDEQQGIKQLNKLQKLKGDPGRWASLNLARRGDKEAMERLIWSFHGIDFNDSGMDVVPRRNLSKRMMVLLSNSASHSNIPKPPDMTKKSVKFYAVSEWWDKYKNKITLYDPWLDTLKEQIVD